MQKFIFIFMLLFMSCQKEIKLPPTQIPQKVVVNCLFSPAQNWKVYVSLSTNPNDAEPPIVENALVKVFENGQYLETLSYVEKGKYVGNKHPFEGNTYNIEVSVPNFESVTATDSIPEAVKIKDAFFTARKVLDVTGAPMLQQNIIFQDPPTKTNFYEITGALDYYFVTDIWGVFYPFKQFGAYAFSDEALAGQSVTFVTTESFTENPGIPDSLYGSKKIFLHSLSPTHYKFLKTGHIQMANNFSGAIETWTSILSVTEPQNIYSNIQGGLGIFAAYNSDTMVTRYIK